MGRPRLDTQDHKANGTYQPCRHAPAVVEPVEFEPMYQLEGYALEYWEKIIVPAQLQGRVMPVDKAGLTELAKLYFHVRTAEAEIDYRGYVMTTENGMTVHPQLRAYDLLLRAFSAREKQYGFTTVSRNNLKPIKIPERTEADEIL